MTNKPERLAPDIRHVSEDFAVAALVFRRTDVHRLEIPMSNKPNFRLLDSDIAQAEVLAPETVSSDQACAFLWRLVSYALGSGRAKPSSIGLFVQHLDRLEYSDIGVTDGIEFRRVLNAVAHAISASDEPECFIDSLADFVSAVAGGWEGVEA